MIHAILEKQESFWKPNKLTIVTLSGNTEYELSQYIEITSEWILEYASWSSSDGGSSKIHRIKNKIFIGNAQFEDKR